MSFLTALFTSRSGMEAHTAQLGHISDNIANATTTGYKKIETRFIDMVARPPLPPQAAVNNIDAVRAFSYFNNRGQGVLSNSSTSTHFAVSGQGFIPVARASSIDSSTGEISFDDLSYFTRKGDFEPTIDGSDYSSVSEYSTAGLTTSSTLGNHRYLTNSAGYYLMGVQYSATNANATAEPEVIRLDMSGIAATPTTTVNYVANLPAGATVGSTYPGDTAIYDSNGNQVALGMSWQLAAANTWTLTTTINGVATTPATTTVTFDTAGRLANPATAAITAGTSSVTINFGTVGSATNTLTQYGGSSTVNATNVTQNGSPAQSAKNIGIDSNGNVYIEYSGGSRVNQFTINLAMFREPNRLERVDGDAFLESADGRSANSVASGAVSYTSPGNLGAGSISPLTLENSTVDIADEFTQMIMAQRAYSFNATAYRTNDDMWKIANQLR